MTRPVTSSAQVPTAAGLPVEDVTSTLSDRKTYIEPGGRVGERLDHPDTVDQPIEAHRDPAIPRLGLRGRWPLRGARTSVGARRDAGHEQECRQRTLGRGHDVIVPDLTPSVTRCGFGARQAAAVRVEVTHCMRRLLPLVILVLAAGCRPATQPPATPAESRLVLPGGFEATVFHDGVGRARHLAVTQDGIVYVKLRGPARGQTPAQFKGAGGAARHRRRRPRRPGRVLRRLRGHGRLRHRRCASTRATSTSRPPARSTARSCMPGTLVPTTPVELVLKHNYRQPGRSYEHIAKPIAFDEAGPPVRAVRRARRHLPGQEPPAGRAWRRPVRPAGVAWRRLAVRRAQGRSDREGRQALRDRHPQPRRDDLEPARQATCTRCSTGATISTGRGRSTSRAGRARCCRPRSSSASPRASTAAGRSTTSTGCRARSCSTRSTAATARRKARAPS